LFEQSRGQLKGLFLVTQTQGDTGYFRDHLEGGSQRFAPEGSWLVGRYAGRFAIKQNTNLSKGIVCINQLLNLPCVCHELILGA